MKSGNAVFLPLTLLCQAERSVNNFTTSVYRGLARKSKPPATPPEGATSASRSLPDTFQLGKIPHLPAAAVTDYKAEALAAGKTFAARIDPLRRSSAAPRPLDCRSGWRRRVGPLALGSAAVSVIPALGSVRVSPV
jgi:hypothetical protein